MQQTIHGDCRELATFACKYLSVCLHNPFSRKLSTVFITLTESMNKINCFLAIALPSGKVVQVSPFFASVLCQIKLNTLKLHSIQNNTFCVYCNFSVLEAVTNFSFIAVYSLPCSSALFLVFLTPSNVCISYNWQHLLILLQFLWDSSNKLTLTIVIHFLSCDLYECK